MTDQASKPGISETLSAFLDGEANPEEMHTLLEDLHRDPRLRAALDHHHRLRASLRGELHPGLGDDFVSRIMEKIGTPGHEAATDKVIRLTPRRQYPLMRATLGLAIAASLAAVTVLTAQLLIPSGHPAFPVLTADRNPATKAAVDPQRPWINLSPDAAAELSNYLISHNQSALDHGLNGRMGFMRVAAGDSVDFDGSNR
jgi:anti-sigma factor RsiW